MDTLTTIGLTAAGMVLAALALTPLMLPYGKRNGLYRKGQE
jgi:hypothetical protein